MVSKEAVLLILKQNQGIRYTDVLSNILGDYSSTNSARAALSRTIRYLSALGLIKKKGDALFITNKGVLFLYSRMKSKLIIKLNKSVKDKDAAETVKQLSVFIERSKVERELLDIAKKNVGFYLCDIEAIEASVERQAKQLFYLSSVLKKQIEALKEMDFPNRRIFSKELLSAVFRKILASSEKGELMVTAQKGVLEKIAENLQLQVSAKTLAVPYEKAQNLIDFLAAKPVRAKIAFQGFLITLGENIEVVAPAKKLESI
ncbi:MAG: hypothetical protein QXM75_04330 [Candidatus Diapherotrites archaeon]